MAGESFLRQLQHSSLFQTLAEQRAHDAGDHDLGEVQRDERIDADGQRIAQITLHLEHEPCRAQHIASRIAKDQAEGGDDRLAVALFDELPPMKASSR